jgi:hypothetical protein
MLVTLQEKYGLKLTFENCKILYIGDVWLVYLYNNVEHCTIKHNVEIVKQ